MGKARQYNHLYWIPRPSLDGEKGTHRILGIISWSLLVGGSRIRVGGHVIIGLVQELQKAPLESPLSGGVSVWRRSDFAVFVFHIGVSLDVGVNLVVFIS